MKYWKYLFIILSLAVITIWVGLLLFPDDNLHLVVCSVGQGDAILASVKQTQILIDAGPGKRVIDCLSNHMPFWDRTIELVLLTHPQKDHYLGLIDIFERYKIDYFLANPLQSSDLEYQVLKDTVGGSGARIVNPVKGMRLGNSLIYLDILFPSYKFLEENLKLQLDQKPTGELNLYSSALDKNEFSIVSILYFGKFKGLFTGDINNKIIDQLVDGLTINNINLLKVPHHGSKNGLTKKAIAIVRPEIAVISVGKDNSYGHPHKEILDLLQEFKIPLYRTDVKGDIEIVSDGRTWWLKKE